MKTSLPLAGIFMLLILVVALPKPQVDATHSPSDTLTYHLVYITHNKSCYNYDIQIMNKYNEITTHYLTGYGLQHFYYDPLCISEKKFESYQKPKYLDILIIVYSKSLGREVLHENNIGGFFRWINESDKQELRIEVCDCPSFKYGDPVWVLSHELSHFALFYLGFGPEAYVDWVHNNQAIYYQYCKNGDYRDSHCPPIFMKLEGSSYDYSVMVIPEEAHSATPPQKKFNSDSAPQKKEVSSKNKKDESVSKFDYKKEALKLQSLVNSKIESTKPGVYLAKIALESTYFKNAGAKKEIDKAWTSFYWAKKYLGDAEWTQKEGQALISKLKWEDAYYKYKYSSEQVNKISKYLSEITNYITRAKSLEK